MARKIFYNREKELNSLNEMWKTPKFEFTVIYGRRRIGKTELIKQFLKNKKGIYFLCSKRKPEYNLRKFSERVCDFLEIPKVEFENFQDAFKMIAKNKGKIAVAIDEFGYLIKKDPGILSDFQEIVDEVLKHTKIKLILCGSSISMMETNVLGFSSPLYGRITKQIKLKAFEIDELLSWFPNTSIEDIIKIYAVTGGIAKYLEFFSGKNVENEIKKLFFDSSSFLYADALYLLSEELGDYSTYLQVLEAISLGYNRVNEIGNYTFIQPKDVFFYLKNLISLGIVRRVVPLLSPRRFKRGIYEIEDLYFNFWFRFVSPYQSEIESYEEKIAIENFERRFNTYLGSVFERVCGWFLRKTRVIDFTKFGKWWHRDKEIDIVALNENTREILFCECKWQSEVNAKKICKELAEKARDLGWYNSERKEYFAIFAKSFKRKISEFEGKKVFCFDLNRIEEELK